MSEISAKNLDEKAVRFAAETIIENALNLHATDVHIEPRDGSTLVRFRIHGILKIANQLPADTSPKLVKYFKKLADLNTREKNFPQTGNIMHGGAKIRVSISPVFSGEKITLRLIRARTSLRKLDETGLWGENLRLVRQAILQPRGIIFTVGDGKNTTNFAILNEINSPEKNIVTVEKTIEKTIPGVNQSEVNPKIGMDFLQTTKSALNQNPDIIMIDEVSDIETAKLLIDAAMRGKLIIASLPVPHASDVIPYLTNLNISPFFLSAITLAIIGQNLIRTVSPAAISDHKLSKTESKVILNEFGISAEKLNKLEKLSKKEGLTKNKLKTTPETLTEINILKSKSDASYIGSIGIFEVLSFIDTENGDKFRKFTLTNPTNIEFANFIQKNDIVKVKVDGLIRVLAGQTVIEEVLRKTGL